MVGNIEAIGDAMTGGVIGRAVEPNAGEAVPGHAQETHCLNCGAELTGAYCNQCGQHAHAHRTLSAFFHDLLHGVFHFEGKFWNTLPLLAWKPGELTRRYIDGQRARFVSPIALFLFSVFLMFAAVGLLGSHKMTPEAKHDLATELMADQQKLAQLQTKRAAAVKANTSTVGIDDQLTDLKSEIAAIQGVQNGNLGASGLNLSGLPDWLADSIGTQVKNPELLLYKLKTNAYKFSWALIPISVPFVWLLFPLSRRFKLYDHTVFVTYSLSFMTLLVVAGVLFGAIGLGAVASLLFLVPPVHMYWQLKGTYGLSRFGALWRASLLTIFAIIAISLFVSLLVTIGLLD